MINYLDMATLLQNIDCDPRSYFENVFGSFIFSSCIDILDDLLFINSYKLTQMIDNNNYNIYFANQPSYIIDISKRSIVAYFNNNIVLDTKDIRSYLWTNTIITYIYPGYDILLLFYNNKWIIVTEHGFQMNINTDYGIINDIMKLLSSHLNNFSSLNNLYYYHFLYQDNSLKGVNFVNNSLTNNSYKDFKLLASYCLLDHSPINAEIDKVAKVNRVYFSCYDELIVKLDYISYENKINKRFTYSGFDITVIDNNCVKFKYRIYTELFNDVNKSIFNKHNNNIHKIYLELYQKNNLTEIIPFISKYPNEIIHRLNTSMRTISKEILNIYHTTRRKNNPELYTSLPNLYKKILFGLHRVYIITRETEVTNKEEYEETKSITVHDVYYFIKDLHVQQLIDLYKERTRLLKNLSFNNIMNSDCIYTLVQNKLMSDNCV